ncbi:MAG: cytochrome C oxidase subunit IV family protein [Candidatus Thalassarchaeaceae archaeon]|jgi:heme/copper-type cytochrome/quinol oxidase subunit 4|nr:cytochrome C oxidase subunit IV family protein [Candidatus Thalassarchaeaceae archaeon]
MAHYKILGKDPYWMNFYGLMILTLIEVAAVGLDLSNFADSMGYTEKELTFAILWGIGIPKFIMIAAIFMHLYGDADSKILTLTALFPAFFIIVMVLFIGLTHPDAATSLPDWCRPGNYGL